MDRDALIRRLMVTFLAELEEHVDVLRREAESLRAEQSEEGRAERIRVLFRSAHSLKGAARSVDVRPIEETCHHLETILAKARDDGDDFNEPTHALLVAATAALDDAAGRLRRGVPLDSGAPIGALLQRLRAAALTDEGQAPPARAQVPVAPAVDRPARAAPPAAPVQERLETLVRVPAQRLDALLSASGELLVARNAMEGRLEALTDLRERVDRILGQWAADRAVIAPSAAGPGTEATRPRRLRRRRPSRGELRDELRDLDRALEDFQRALTKDLRTVGRTATAVEGEIRRARMVPFAEACREFQPTARALAAAQGKEFELEIEGAEIELDRALLERLKDPILHLVRNAIDHGLELPAERVAQGKPRRGLINVAAHLRGERVEVSVSDDGRGLDLERLRAQARRRGLSLPLEEADHARLALEPGVSTARDVTELSGRGVGLDVVRSRVEALRGHVEVESQSGAGARFVLDVPLTLTRVRALVVSVASQTYAFDSSQVLRVARVAREDIRTIAGRETVSLGDGAPIPVLPLAALLGLDGGQITPEGERLSLVVIGGGKRRVAFAVDELIAAPVVVVKSLGARLARVRHFAGALTLASGQTALVLNGADLLQTAFDNAHLRPMGLAQSAEPRRRRRLLVVDDSVTTRSLMRSLLEAAGYEVKAASDGVEALEMLRQVDADLVVSDVEMPRMDGFALTQAIRSATRHRETPVILVTALESDADRMRGLEVGADAYLIKSAFDQRLLLDTIGQLL